MTIKNLVLKQVDDSRGEPTLSVGLTNDSGQEFWATVPSGKSVGKNEARVIAFPEAVKVLETIKPDLTAGIFNSVSDFDSCLKRLDPSENKAVIGGNLSLCLSLAFAKALADNRNISVSELLHSEFFPGENQSRPPLIFANLINGGKHAHNNLDFQEYLVISDPSLSVRVNIDNLIKLYHSLGETLKKGTEQLEIGDEGGFAPNFSNDFSPIELLDSEIEKLGFRDKFKLGIDAAADSFAAAEGYKTEDGIIDANRLLNKYDEYFQKCPLLYSLEDPFDESNREGFKKARDKFSDKLIIGDDLTVTRPEFIETAAKDGLINAVIIKPNQIGTISQTCEAIMAAKKNSLFVLISHRSGETEETLIIDLAKACNADGVKIGAPIRERIIKYNQLLRLYP